jgi:hypothetical protein
MICTDIEGRMDNKYREGQANEVRQQTYQRLRQQLLAEQAMENGATQLGQEIRRYMMFGWTNTGDTAWRERTRSPRSPSRQERDPGDGMEDLDNGDEEIESTGTDGMGDYLEETLRGPDHQEPGSGPESEGGAGALKRKRDEKDDEETESEDDEL